MKLQFVLELQAIEARKFAWPVNLLLFTVRVISIKISFRSK